MMFEIMGKIILCLIIAVVLGFLIGWLFSQAFISEKDTSYRNDVFLGEDNTKNMFEELQEKYVEKKNLLAEAEMKNRELKGELMKKVNLLQSTSERLKDIQGTDHANSDRVVELENLLKAKESELMEFETVLIKAEKTIEKLSNPSSL